MAELIYKEETYEIVGAAMDVYYTMGSTLTLFRVF